jgi:hypothetical protein
MDYLFLNSLVRTDPLDLGAWKPFKKGLPNLGTAEVHGVSVVGMILTWLSGTEKELPEATDMNGERLD